MVYNTHERKRKMREVNQTAVDASFGIIRDNKRRTIYYDNYVKQAFQIAPKDHKWIKMNHLAFFIAIIFFYLVWILFTGVLGDYRTLVGFIVALVVYGLIKGLFNKLFFKDKALAKVTSETLLTLNQKSTLKEIRSFNRYKLAFVLMYGILIVIDSLSPTMELWLQILSILVVVLLLGFLLKRELDLTKQMKETTH